MPFKRRQPAAFLQDCTAYETTPRGEYEKFIHSSDTERNGGNCIMEQSRAGRIWKS